MREREETRDEYLDREEQHEREQDAREIAFLRAEVERLRAERDGAFTRYDALLWQIANEGCVSARVGEGTRECGLPECGLCRLVHDRDFYRENSAALGDALRIGNAKLEAAEARAVAAEKERDEAREIATRESVIASSALSRATAAEAKAERLAKGLREIETRTGHFGEAPPPPEWMPLLSLIACVGSISRDALGEEGSHV